MKWENLLRILAMAGTSPSYIVRWFPSGAHFVRGFPGHVWSRWSFRIGLCQSTSALVSPLLHFVRSKLVQGSGCWGVTWYITWVCPKMFQPWNPIVYHHFLYEHSIFPNFLDKTVFFSTIDQGEVHAVFYMVFIGSSPCTSWSANTWELRTLYSAHIGVSLHFRHITVL